MNHNPSHLDAVLSHCGEETKQAGKKLKYGTTFQMDIGQTMTTIIQIIQTNTTNCNCAMCSRWDTKAMPTLVKSMEKRGKDKNYIQRLLDNIKNKDFICNKNIIITDNKNKQSAGGVKRWRQHGHGKRIVVIPKPKHAFPIHAPGSDQINVIEEKQVEKKLEMNTESESDWKQVDSTRANKLRNKSRQKLQYYHEQGIDKDEEKNPSIRIKMVKIEIKVDNKMTLQKFFGKKKKKSPKIATSTSTKTWEIVDVDVNNNKKYISDFPELGEENKVENKVGDKVGDKFGDKVGDKVGDKFYAHKVVEHINGNMCSCSKKKAPVIIKMENVCPFWSGHKGRDGCNFGKRCKLVHCKATCTNYIKNGKCDNEYCNKLHSFTATFIPGKEASDAGNIRHKMWKERKRKQRSGGEKRTYSKPPHGYTCRLCGVKGHWIQQCSKAK